MSAAFAAALPPSPDQDDAEFFRGCWWGEHLHTAQALQTSAPQSCGERNRDLDALMNNIPGGVAVLRRHGRTEPLQFSDELLSMLGYKLRESQDCFP